jgi:competence protein ComEC
LKAFAALLDAEANRLALWLPVFMGSGVLSYYALRAEPPLWAGPAAVAVALCVAWRFRGLSAPFLAAAIGFAASQFATARAPPLETGLPTHAVAIEGKVRAVELLPQGRRITVEAVRLDNAGEKLHRTVRVRLRKTDQGPATTGDTVRLRAVIRTPAPPSYPGGWDLQRDAFYAGLGASGYALGPIERLMEAPPSGPARFMQWLRETIANRIAAVIPGAAGAVSTTLLTGGQTSIPEAEHQAFRDSGLAHLLAVAGLHIGIVMGFALSLARLGFACSERASLYWPAKTLTALAALTVGGLYMVLTGMHVPIVRSFTMACLFTLGVVAGRRVVSLRGLGFAGVVLMLLAPHEVPGVSFQMSFSAVLALISGYEALRPWLRQLHGKSWQRRLASHIVALALTSALAGTASAPYGAYHFGHIQAYFVIANMVAVPLTAIWVMPAGLIALALMPFGLEWIALVPMGWGAEIVVWIATTTSSWPAATAAVPHIPAWGLIVFSVGLAWLGIWRTRLRLFGVLPMAIGLLSPISEQQPDVLISADARLIGVRTAEGVFVQQNQGGSAFVRDAWLQLWMETKAKPMPASGEAAGGAIVCEKDFCRLRPQPDAATALLVRGPSRPNGCPGVSVVVSAEPARGLCSRPWPKLADRFTVWREGAAAIWLRPEGAIVVTDRMERGDRPWVPPPPQPRPKPVPTLPPAALDTVSTADVP